MNKKEIRQKRLNRHYIGLENLALCCGVKNPSGKKISLALFKIETEMHKWAVAYCNGQDSAGNPFQYEDWEALTDTAGEKVMALFGGDLPGFFFNADGRGHTLKIDPNRGKYAPELEIDMGGYYILSPDFN